MRRSEAGKHLRLHGRGLRPSDRIVFLVLLERSNNVDCTVPRFMTPSLAELASAAGYSKSAIAEALNHLEKHGWVTRTRSTGGRASKSGYRPSGYQLQPGRPCDAASPAECIRPSKVSAPSDSYTVELSDGADQQLSDESSQTGRSDAVSDVGHRRGRVEREAWPAARIPGVRGDLIPADGETRRALHILADVLGPVEVIEITEPKR